MNNTPVTAHDDAAADQALRPLSFADYTGQRHIISNLETSVHAAKLGGWQLDHQLFCGPPGLGKTSLAQVVGAELGVRVHVTSAPSIAHRGELAGLLTALADGEVLFIDEIHRLPVPLQEMLYSAMEDGRVDLFTADKRAVSLPLAKFTLLGATTHAGLLTGPMRDRFGFVWELEFYTADELATIVGRSATLLGIAVDQDGAAEIARRSRGTPRIANRLLRRVRDHVIVAASRGALVPHGRPANAITAPLAVAALDRLRVDTAGLSALDLRYLTEIAARGGAPVGITAIASALAQQRQTLEDTVEPFLVKLGFIARTPRGRVATAAGQAHLAGAA